MTLRVGSKLERFEITGVLGEGAMGTVYLAHDPQIERPVAIKTLRLDGGAEQSEEIANRFLKEAKLSEVRPTCRRSRFGAKSSMGGAISSPSGWSSTSC